MNLKSQRELNATRHKLIELEAQISELKAKEPKSEVEQLSIKSLVKLSNQLKEEVARFESRSRVQQ